MKLSTHIQIWLGLHTIQEKLRIIAIDIKNLEKSINNLSTTQASILPGIGRVIAKLEPTYGDDELSFAKRVESDRIAKLAIDKLYGESLARRHTEGKL